MRASSRRVFPGLPALLNTAYSLGWLVERSSLAARGFVSSSGPRISLAKEIEMNRPTIARAFRAGMLTIALGMLTTGAFAQQPPAPKGPPPTAAQVQLASDIIAASGAARA